MNTTSNNYQAYLIRFRRGEASLRWQVSLQDVHGDLSLHFKELSDLIDFFQAHFSEQEGVHHVESASQRDSASNDDHNGGQHPDCNRDMDSNTDSDKH